MLLVAFVAENLLEAIKCATIGHLTSGKRTHSVQAGAHLIERHGCESTNECSSSCSPESVDPVRTEEVVRRLLAVVVNTSH
jgi:hypothetical protein